MEPIDVTILLFLIIDIIAIGILIYTYTPSGKKWTGQH